MNAEVLQALLAARAAAQPVAVATNLRTGYQLLVRPDGTEIGELCLDVDMTAAIQDAIRRDANITLPTGAGEVFVHVYNPPPRAMIVGAVHIAEPLARMASLAGYGVHVIDPRRGFANRDRFEGFQVHGDWPDEALAALKPDARTAIVTLTHDPKLDDPALLAALASPAFYIGALGSRRTHAARLGRLAERGASPEALKRIHGPVGLDIGALSPAEIAVSIVAQITQVRRGGAP